MDKFLIALTALAPAMRFDMTAEILSAYELTLSRYPEERLLACIPELGLRHFFPRPSDFKDMLDPEGPEIEDRAQAAWSQLKAQAWGQRGAPDDLLYQEAMRGICDLHCIRQASEKELIGYGFEFRAAFRVLAEKEKTEDTLALIDSRAAGLIGEASKSLDMGRG